jgi:RNA polymerase sigma-70 factor (ECF subfamily)
METTRFNAALGDQAPDSPAAPREDANCVLQAWRAHERELLAYLVRRSGNSDLAEEVLQDVFAKALLQGRVFCALGNRRAWLYEVARNTLVDRARLAKPTTELPDSLAAPVEEQPAVEALAECLPRALAELPEEDRDILIRCDVEGRGQKAYADDRGLTLPAAKSRLLRARRRLREHLVENCQVSFDDAGRVCCHVPRDT